MVRTAHEQAEHLNGQLRTIQMLLDLAVARIENLNEPQTSWERDLHVLIEEIEEARQAATPSNESTARNE